MDLQRIRRVLKTRSSRAGLMGLAYRYGLWRTTIWLAAGPGLAERIWRATALKNRGDAIAAGVLIDGALRELPSARSFHGLLNPALDILIALGRYRDALALEQASSALLRDGQWVLAQSNLAEAEYCQGQRERAQARLSEPALDAVSASIPFAKSSLALQRAWLAVELGDARTALAQVASVSPADSPRS